MNIAQKQTVAFFRKTSHCPLEWFFFKTIIGIFLRYSFYSTVRAQSTELK